MAEKTEIRVSESDSAAIDKAIEIVHQEIERIDKEIAVLTALRNEILARCEGGVPF